MFKEMFMKHYKSQGKLTPEEAETLQTQKQQLINENEQRLNSIFKLKQLIVDDPENKNIYNLHIRRNRDWINKVKKEIDVIDIKLLEK
jgi:uncharacterized protein YciW